MSSGGRRLVWFIRGGTEGRSRTGKEEREVGEGKKRERGEGKMDGRISETRSAL